MRLRPVLIGVTLALAILIMAIAQASGARQQTSIGKASLQVVTKMPSSPQQDTVRLAQAIASPSLSIPKRVSLASGGVTLDPVDASVSPKVSREQVTTQFKRSALLGPQTATAAPDVRLVRLTRPHSSWKDRLVWAVIMLAVPDQLGSIGPAPDPRDDTTGPSAGSSLATTNTIAFYDSHSGEFLMALQQSS